MYQAFGLLKPDSDFTLAAAAKKLAAKFPDYSVVHDDTKLTMSSGDWEMRLCLNLGPEVLEQSRAIEEKIGGDQDDIGIVTCARRVEVSSDTPDPEMEHFNDYLSVIEVLKSFQGLMPWIRKSRRSSSDNQTSNSSSRQGILPLNRWNCRVGFKSILRARKAFPVKTKTFQPGRHCGRLGPFLCKGLSAPSPRRCARRKADCHSNTPGGPSSTSRGDGIRAAP